jgi:hypothetical protein
MAMQPMATAIVASAGLGISALLAACSTPAEEAWKHPAQPKQAESSTAQPTVVLTYQQGNVGPDTPPLSKTAPTMFVRVCLYPDGRKTCETADGHIAEGRIPPSDVDEVAHSMIEQGAATFGWRMPPCGSSYTLRINGTTPAECGWSDMNPGETARRWQQKLFDIACPMGSK